MSAYRQQAPKPIELLDVKAERAKERKPLTAAAKNWLVGGPLMGVLLVAMNVWGSSCHEGNNVPFVVEHPLRLLNALFFVTVSSVFLVANRMEGWPFKKD